MLTGKLGQRVKFPNGEQKKFLEQTLSILDIKLSELAAISGVCGRTLRDWKREKCNMSFSSLKTICAKRKISVPKNIKILPEYWSVKKASKLGGRRRVELYGNPGTPEGRRKGGIKTQKKFRSDPAYAKKMGFILRKEIKYPERSVELAEFMGIMLGDGGLSGSYQITISFDNKNDRKYAEYICNSLKKLFSVNYHIYKREKNNGADIVVSSSNLVDFLIRQGFIKGNKTKNQIDAPGWIYERSDYQIACLRGLMDTDGGLYLHRYNSNGKTYEYLKLCFANVSKPLLHFVFDVLSKLNYKVYLNGDNVSIYATPEVKRYFAEIGTHNPKQIKKFKDYFILTP